MTTMTPEQMESEAAELRLRIESLQEALAQARGAVEVATAAQRHVAAFFPGHVFEWSANSISETFLVRAASDLDKAAREVEEALVNLGTIIADTLDES